MNFGNAFTFAFQDSEWLKKVGIAAAIFLIPVIGPIIAMGWGLEITRRVINNQTDLLPDWSDFGGYVSKGFQAFVVTLVFSLPYLLISVCQQGIGVLAAGRCGGFGRGDGQGSVDRDGFGGCHRDGREHQGESEGEPVGAGR